MGSLAYPAVVGRVLTKVRERRNETQSAVAQRLGTSQPAYSRWESGESAMNLSQFYRVCGALEIAPGNVLQWADELAADLRRKGVEVVHEKPEDKAAALIGFGILAALLLSGSR